MAKELTTYDDEEVQWGGYDEEAAAEHELELAEGGASEFDKGLKKEGRHIRRILPPPRGSGWGPKGKDSPLLFVWEHTYTVGDTFVKFTCPQKEEGRECFACIEASRMIRSAIPEERNLGFEIRARQVAYLQWFDPTEEDPTIKIYTAGKTIQEQLVDLRNDSGDFSHPTKGYQITVRRKGVGRRDTKYKLYAGERSPLSDFDFKPTDLKDLMSYRVIPSEEDMEAYYDQMAEAFGLGAPKKKPRQLGQGARSRKRLEAGGSLRTYDPDEEEGLIIDHTESDDDWSESSRPKKRSRRRR